MPSYNKQHSISTYLINKSLIESIENYFEKNVSEILSLKIPDSKTYSRTEVIVHDSHGQEGYKSIKEYKLSHFRNDITGITINYRLYAERKDASITIRFGLEKDNTDLAINLTDDNAREKVCALEQGILDILNQNKTNNWLLYPVWYLNALLVLGVLYTGLLTFSGDSTRQESRIYGIITGTLLMYLWVFHYFKNYSSFDTEKQKQLDKWFAWLLMGLLSFLLFTTLLTSLRKSLLGF